LKKNRHYEQEMGSLSILEDGKTLPASKELAYLPQF
jgi:hypothetical protein